MDKNHIEIILPTYNGEKYLPELLASLVNQTCNDFVLITYDDGSKDRSVEIVDSFSGRLPIVRLANPASVNRGAAKSFAYLLSHCTSDCVMLCDQDDYWDSVKIATGWDALARMRSKYGDVPLLVFSDLEIIDNTGKTVALSFFEYNRSNLGKLYDPYCICYKNPVPGCSMILNRRMVRASLPIGTDAIMHDWWIFIVAALLGKIGYCKEPLVRYRKHQTNTMGPVRDNPFPPLHLLFSIFSGKNIVTLFRAHGKIIRQARQAFLMNGRTFSIYGYFASLVVNRYLTRGRGEAPSAVPIFFVNHRFHRSPHV